jgi:NAD(P)-dependent dehydrogenase (short-subunit alcohol dehydrogenase family)
LRLADRHAAITGAARGIGRAIAIGFAREGASVSCIDVDLAGAKATADQIVQTGGAAVPVSCDVTDFEQVRLSLETAAASFGPVSILVANAGGAHGVGRCDFLDLTPEKWRAMLDLNLNGAFYSGLVFGHHMAANRQGSIVFVTSQGSETAQRGLAHYCAAKGGVRQLMRVMAAELAPLGVRVNAVAPGPTETEGNQVFRQDKKAVRELATGIPMGRWGQASEVVGAALYLAGDEASFTTGTTIFVDGGYTIV